MNRIVLICDENYVMPTEVMIQSICDSANRYGGIFEISVCTWKISPKSIQSLEQHSKENVRVQVVLVDPSNYEERMRKINQNSHVTPTALIKFELAQLFPTDKEVLYLDSDMIVKGNINEFFSVNLGDNLVAASYEYWKYLLKQYQYTNDTTVPAFYFNSGVMLLNLEAFRKENISEKLWQAKFELFNENTFGKFALMDQDVFNEVCKGRILELPIRFNCNTRFTHDVSVSDINKVFHTDYQEVTEIKRDAIILHYVGKEDKPWRYANVACQDVWDHYYRLTRGEPSLLQREKPKRNVRYYINCISDSLKKRGLINTIRYSLAKIK